MSEQSKLNQSSKSTSSKRIRRERDISLSSPHREFPAATSTFSGLVIMFIMLLLGLVINNNTYASSISVAISGEMNLDLLASDEGMFGTSTASTISVVSSNSSGYTLTLLGDRTDGKLIGTSSDHYFTSISGPLTATEFNTVGNNGKWGILPSKYESVDNNRYQKAPISTTATTIDTTAAANYTPNTYTLAIAARASTGANTTTPADQYSGTFTLAATGNAIDYDIAYVDYDSGLPGLTSGASSTGTASLSSTVPTKAGYEFAGWCTVPVTTGAACTGTTYPASGNYTLSSSGDNNVTLYAIWDPVTFAEAYGSTAMTMQNMTTAICNAVAIGQEGTLTDTRGGGKNYTVGKMKDGHCWMLDNLALGGNSAITLKNTDTNIASDWTLPASTATNFHSYTIARINTDYINVISTDTMDTSGQWKIGAYYNYCAASAGTYCPAGDASTTPVASDICPKGWRIPSGGLGGEYRTLWNAYGNNTMNLRTVMHLSLSGYYDNSQVRNQSVNGFRWSSTFYDNNIMYDFGASTSGVDPLSHNYRVLGMSLRCIAK